MNQALLSRLRSMLSADPTRYECCLSLSEVREIVGALEDAEQMKKQIEVDGFVEQMRTTPPRLPKAHP